MQKKLRHLFFICKMYKKDVGIMYMYTKLYFRKIFD